MRLTDSKTTSVLLDISLASSNRSRAIGGATLRALPCPHGRYLFTATEETLGSVPEGSYSAHLAMGDAKLPSGIECHHTLPASLGRGHLSIEVTGATGRAVYFKITGERQANGQLEGVIPERSNITLCSGTYRFVARLQTSRGLLIFQYPFALSHINGGNC